MPRTLVILGIALFATGSLATDIEWRHRAVHDTVSLMANPLGVASRISFYEGRGFTSSAIEPYAQACPLFKRRLLTSVLPIVLWLQP